MFPQQTEEMTKFLKVNGLSLKEERDLKKIFEYYTGLVK
jgi:prophage maintenance system killer protein